MLPAMAEIYRHIERHAGPSTVVASSGIAFGARLAQERLGVPTATVHLQPSIIRSLVDQGMAGNVRISASQPMWFKRAFFRLADWLLMDRVLKRPVNEFRATLGLPPVDRVMYRWLHSPQLVIGFFPEWFAAFQPDWPPHTHLVGFPLWDTAAAWNHPRGCGDVSRGRRATGRLHAGLGRCDDAPLLPGVGGCCARARRARDARHELPGSGAQRSSVPRQGLRVSARSATCCLARRCSCITAASARWRRPSRPGFPTSWFPTGTISSTTAFASNGSAWAAAFRRPRIGHERWPAPFAASSMTASSARDAATIAAGRFGRRPRHAHASHRIAGDESGRRALNQFSGARVSESLQLLTLSLQNLGIVRETGIDRSFPASVHGVRQQNPTFSPTVGVLFRKGHAIGRRHLGRVDEVVHVVAHEQQHPVRLRDLGSPRGLVRVHPFSPEQRTVSSVALCPARRDSRA